MSYQLYTIGTPSVHLIPGGLHVGKQIIIRGRMYQGGDNFAINLQHDQHEGSKIAFHFNPRHSDRIVVRNSFDGAWESEERDDVYYYPFGNNDEFSMRILVTDSEYKVYADGYHMLDFRHRHGLQDVNYIGVAGDCYFYDIAFQDKLRPPYVGRIPGNFHIGKAVRIRGVVGDRGDGTFAANFQCDHAGEEIAYHFNPRPEDEEVVRNSKLGDWGDEEKGIPHFPFHRGNFFDLFVVATDDGFSTYVNGEFFTNFSYRSEVQNVSHVAISGDLEIADFQYFDETRDNTCKEIPSGLKKGDTMLVRGVFNPDGDTFSINLQHELDHDSDVAFHFNPRRSQEQVIINSCYGGEWGDEIMEDLPSVFRGNSPFDLRLVAKRNKIKVFCDGKYITKFEARNPILDIVKSINMKGDAYIHQVKLQREVVVPYTEKFPGQVTDDEWISISGTFKKDNANFSLNLTCGPSEDDDIALHFNPRIEEGRVVRNSKENGEWHSEEDEQDEFPFQNADVFETILHIKSEYIQIFVNGRKFATFNHRMPHNRISHVRLMGNANFFQPEFF